MRSVYAKYATPRGKSWIPKFPSTKSTMSSRLKSLRYFPTSPWVWYRKRSMFRSRSFNGTWRSWPLSVKPCRTFPSSILSWLKKGRSHSIFSVSRTRARYRWTRWSIELKAVAGWRNLCLTLWMCWSRGWFKGRGWSIWSTWRASTRRSIQTLNGRSWIMTLKSWLKSSRIRSSSLTKSSIALSSLSRKSQFLPTQWPKARSINWETRWCQLSSSRNCKRCSASTSF